MFVNIVFLSRILIDKPLMAYKIAVVGATGLVGNTILRVLEESGIAISELIPVASTKSAGKAVLFNGQSIPVCSIEEALARDIDIALFSAGGRVSKEYAPTFAANNTIVIDNSSAFRMDADKKLVIPEVNGVLLTKTDRIIANPNCSTIQMVMALAPLHKASPIKRLVISTYQSITGTGIKAVRQLEDERAGKEGEKAYPHNIDKNCLPHCDDFSDDGYTKEELKLVNETKKILGDDRIHITATAVRVPVVGGHSESVNVEFNEPMEVGVVKELLHKTSGVIVLDNPEKNEYPMPINVAGKDEVFVGRIRKDLSNPNAINLWIVADNLRKGAATNAVQIAEHLIKNGLV